MNWGILGMSFASTGLGPTFSANTAASVALARALCPPYTRMLSASAGAHTLRMERQPFMSNNQQY